jgi:predicted GIY-YIG superfamily endonuclease
LDIRTIYALEDPLNGDIFYVGQSLDVYTRFSDHLQGRGRNQALKARILACREKNVMVMMVTLEQVNSEEEARERERYWIGYFLERGHPLTNTYSIERKGVV